MENLKIAIKAAIEASKKILEIYHKDFQVFTKDDNSPLTEADIVSNKIIKNYLKKTNIPILSEEEIQTPYKIRKNWDLLWIIDPIDGTKEFIKKNGEFSVNIALVKESKPILGVIVAPVLKCIYFSTIEFGSFKCENLNYSSYNINNLIKNSIKLPVTVADRKYTVVASRSHMSKETDKYINMLKKKHKNISIVSKGSSLKICLVAEGKADSYPRFAPTMEWDTAAGHAICNGAGYKLIDYETKKEMLYNREELKNNWFIVNK